MQQFRNRLILNSRKDLLLLSDEKFLLTGYINNIINPQMPACVDRLMRKEFFSEVAVKGRFVEYLPFLIRIFLFYLTSITSAQNSGFCESQSIMSIIL